HVEDWVTKKLRGSKQRLRKMRGRIRIAVPQIESTEGPPDGFKCVGARAFVDRNTDAVAVHFTQVNVVIDSVLHNEALVGADLHGDRVEERGRRDLEAEASETICETASVAVYTKGNGI